MDDGTTPQGLVTPSPDQEILRRLGVGAGKSSWRRPVLVLLILLLLGAVAVWGLQHPEPPSYQTQTITRGDLNIYVNATGALAPRDQVDVGAEVSGRIDAVRVDFNSRVRKGQVLAQINADQIDAQLKQARASQTDAAATYKQTASTLARTSRLAADGAASRQALEIATGDRDRAAAAVARSNAQAAQLQSQLEKTTIRAPIDGVVLDRKVEPGQTVVASLQTPVLFTLASDLSNMELDADIDEADVGQVQAGQVATFTVDAHPGVTFRGTLVTVHNSPKIVNGVVTYRGVIWVDNPKSLLKPGMTANATITSARAAGVLLVPNAALRFSPAGADAAALQPQDGAASGRLWLLKDGRLVSRDVQLGLSDGRFTEIIGAALAEGEAVVIATSSGEAKPPAKDAEASAPRPAPQERTSATLKGNQR